MLVESNERSGDDRSSSDSGAFTDIQVQATDRALNEPRSNAGIFRALIDAGLLSEGGRVELRYRYNGQQSRTYGVVGFNAQRTRIDLNNRVPREAQGALCEIKSSKSFCSIPIAVAISSLLGCLPNL